MAIKIEYICDSCGCQVTPENGVLGDQEFTIEMGENGKKVCIQISLCNFDIKDTEAALCSRCIKNMINNWILTGKNYLVNDDIPKQE